MTAFYVRPRSDAAIGGQVELRPTRVGDTRFLGGVVIAVGVGLAFGGR